MSGILTGVTKPINPQQLAEEIQNRFPAVYRTAGLPTSIIELKGDVVTFGSSPYIDDGTNFQSVNVANGIGNNGKSWSAKIGFSFASQMVNRVLVYSSIDGERDDITIPPVVSYHYNLYDNALLIGSSMERYTDDTGVSYQQFLDEFKDILVDSSRLVVEIIMTVASGIFVATLYQLWIETFALANVTWEPSTEILACAEITTDQLAQALMYHNAYFPPQMIPDEIISSVAPEKLEAGTLAAGKKLLAKEVIVPNEKNWRIELTGDQYIIRYWNGDNTKFYADDIGNLVIVGTFIAGAIEMAGFHVDANGNLGVGGSSFAKSPFKANADGSIIVTDGISFEWPGDDLDRVKLSVMKNVPGMLSLDPLQGLSFGGERSAVFPSAKPWLQIGNNSKPGFSQNIWVTSQDKSTQPTISLLDDRPPDASIIFPSVTEHGGGGVHLYVRDQLNTTYNLSEGSVLSRLTTQTLVSNTAAETTLFGPYTFPASWFGEDTHIEAILHGNLKAVGSISALFKWYIGSTVIDSFILPMNEVLISNARGTTGQPIGGLAVSEMQGQSFTVFETVTISAIDLILSISGTPTDNIVVELLDAIGTGTVLATKSIASASLVSVGTTWNRFTFASPVTVSPGIYFIRISRSGALDNVNRWNVPSSTDNSFMDGARYTRSSSVWSIASNGFSDISFQVIGTGATGLFIHTNLSIRDLGSPGTIVCGSYVRADPYNISTPSIFKAIDTAIANDLKLTVQMSAASASDQVSLELGYLRIACL